MEVLAKVDEEYLEGSQRKKNQKKNSLVLVNQDTTPGP